MARSASAGASVLLALAALTSCTAPAADAGAAQADEGPVFPDQNRPDVRGLSGALSSDHPLATAAGYEVLRRGGNAMDAAITMAGVLAVTRPHMNGVGGDAFALIYDAESGTVSALNGSGAAGDLATPAFFAQAGDTAMPQVGPRSVSVPGAVRAWEDALARFGTLSLAEALQPAIHYARDGFPVSTRLAQDIEEQGGDLDDAGRAQYLPGGVPPAVGSLLKNPALAETLERIATQGSGGFYEGPVARSIADLLEARGGYLRAGDLASHRSQWVDPLSMTYQGYRMLVMPPNTQGFAQLQQFAMAEEFDLVGMGPQSADYWHTLIELKKLAFADRDAWAADPDMAELPIDQLLDPDYLRQRASMVDPEHAATDVTTGVPRPGVAADASAHGDEADGGDTVYLTVVDQWGNAVSWIQSLFAGFGSGVFDPETGVMLQNRGALFTLEEGHPNQVAPGKRPYHTLSPMMALHGDGTFAFTMGTPGGDSQTQSLLAITNNLLLFGMTPQQAIEAPRYRSNSGTSVSLEDRFPAALRAELERRGHRIRLVHGWTATFGGAQMIVLDRDNGVRTVASDPRREAYGLAY
ncbi:MAG: gamma-glutamyltransferase [Gemmatimonadetes bacterium]|nr:gamma-glutamyltransferase [Gemmatimonadota bacterium]